MAQPKVITFIGMDRLGASKYSYEVLGYREPRKGEWYLSGAVVEAYKAPNDLPYKYTVVKPLVEHRQRQVWMVINHE